MVEINSEAKKYLNILGFFICLKDKIQRDIAKQIQNIKKDKDEIDKFYDNFKQDMEIERSFRLAPFKPEERVKQDREIAG